MPSSACSQYHKMWLVVKLVHRSQCDQTLNLMMKPCSMLLPCRSRLCALFVLATESNSLFYVSACRRCLWMGTSSARFRTSWEDWRSSTAWVSHSTVSPTSLPCWRDWALWTSWPWLETGWRVWTCAHWHEWASWKILTSGKPGCTAPPFFADCFRVTRVLREFRVPVWTWDYCDCFYSSARWRSTHSSFPLHWSIKPTTTASSSLILPFWVAVDDKRLWFNGQIHPWSCAFIKQQLVINGMEELVEK